MQTINLNNYEAFLLDYLEGNLKEELCEELKLFALSHPELEIDLEEKSLPAFEAEKMNADFKADLKKTKFNFPDELLINYLENKLSQAERDTVEAKLRNDSELASDLEQYKKTILRPDPALIFSNKIALLKSDHDLVLNSKLLAYFENTLSDTEKTEFESALNASISLQNELRLVSRTKLSPDLSEIYPGKEALKKQTKIIALFNLRAIGAIAAAALLLLVIGFVFKYYNSRITSPGNLANTSGGKKEMILIPNHSISGKASKPILQNENESVKKQVHVAQIKHLRIDSVFHSSTPVAKFVDQVTGNTKTENDKLVEKQVVVPEKIQVAETTSTITSTISTGPDSNSSMADNTEERLRVVKVFEEADNDPEEVAQPGKGFWKKIVKLAKRANQLGIKSVDGVENPNESFSLSLNAFKVERH